MFIVSKYFWRVINLPYFSLFQPLKFLSVFGLAFLPSLIIKGAHGNWLKPIHLICHASINKEESKLETFWIMVSSRNCVGFQKAHKVLILQFSKVLTFQYGLFILCFPVLYWVSLQEKKKEKMSYYFCFFDNPKCKTLALSSNKNSTSSNTETICPPFDLPSTTAWLHTEHLCLIVALGKCMHNIQSSFVLLLKLW